MVIREVTVGGGSFVSFCPSFLIIYILGAHVYMKTNILGTCDLQINYSVKAPCYI